MGLAEVVELPHVKFGSRSTSSNPKFLLQSAAVNPDRRADKTSLGSAGSPAVTGAWPSAKR